MVNQAHSLRPINLVRGLSFRFHKVRVNMIIIISAVYNDKDYRVVMCDQICAQYSATQTRMIYAHTKHVLTDKTINN